MEMERMRRPFAVLAIVAGVALGVVSAGPLAWGLGCVIALALVVGGWVVLTDLRPPECHARPFDHARDA